MIEDERRQLALDMAHRLLGGHATPLQMQMQGQLSAMQNVASNNLAAYGLRPVTLDDYLAAAEKILAFLDGQNTGA